MTSDAFVRHYTAVADASPVPVLLYNVSMFTGVNLLPDAVERLAAHPNIIGMKESNADLVQLAETIARTPDDFVVLGGSAPTFYHALCAGADGGVLAISGVVPDLCVEMFDLVREQRHAEALALQRRITPLGRLLGAMHGVAGLKYALDQIGYVGGPTRPPLGTVSAGGAEADPGTARGAGDARGEVSSKFRNRRPEGQKTKGRPQRCLRWTRSFRGADRSTNIAACSR